MQGSHRKLIADNWSIIAIIAATPLLLWATIQVLPTFDDWTTLCSPTFEPLLTKERFLFFGYHWRPFDSIMGYILGLNPQRLFPTLNHCCVVLGHVGCSLLVNRTASTLGFSRMAVNTSTLFFFIAPATMATVLAVDSLNQTYALLWGMTSFLAYIKLRRGKYALWPLLIFISALCKENGLMWAVICPVLAFGFDLIGKATLKKDLTIGAAIVAAYAAAIILLPKDIIIHPEYVPGATKVVSNTVKFLFTSFVTVDYVYLLHQPSRNLLMASAGFLLALPFAYYAFISRPALYRKQRGLCIVASLLIAVAPHVATVFSMMHTYAGFSIVALLAANTIDTYRYATRRIATAFLLFVVAATAIDIHLWNESRLSGLTGREMAATAIRNTGKQADNVLVIIIEDDYPKLSSFCVIPNEAFGWGLASRHETNYKWPKAIEDTIISRSEAAPATARQIAKEALDSHQHDCVWIVDRKDVEVIRPEI